MPSRPTVGQPAAAHRGPPRRGRAGGARAAGAAGGFRFPWAGDARCRLVALRRAVPGAAGRRVRHLPAAHDGAVADHGAGQPGQRPARRPPRATGGRAAYETREGRLRRGSCHGGRRRRRPRPRLSPPDPLVRGPARAVPGRHAVAAAAHRRRLPAAARRLARPAGPASLLRPGQPTGRRADCRPSGRADDGGRCPAPACSGVAGPRPMMLAAARAARRPGRRPALPGRARASC